MFTDALIRRQNLPRDVFQFIRACAYDREVPKDYRKDAQKILKADYDLANAPRTPIKRTSKHNGLEKECDALVRQLVYARDGLQCVKCGGTKALTPSHILAKGHCKRLRWDPHNILTMCWPCHCYWWHDNPAGAMLWMEEHYPGRLQTLREIAATAGRIDLKELAIALRLEVQNL